MTVIHFLPLMSTGAPVGGSAIRQIYTRCSDPNVILDCKPMQPGDPHDIFLKVVSSTFVCKDL